MLSARRLASTLLLATTAVGTLGAGVAHARPGDLVPTPPSPPVPLTYAIADAAVAEGDPVDADVLSFEVTASRANGVDVTFRAHTGNLGFEASPGVDFTPIDEIVTMPAGATSLTVEVPVTGDLDVEDEELVIVWLGEESAGTVTDDTAIGRIDDDDTPTIHISQVTQAEGTGGPTGFHFTVSLSHASDQPVSVDLWTTPGSATSPSDYQAAPATIVFAPGQTSADYVVSVVGDSTPEGDEELVVEMGNASGGTIVGGAGLGTIVDDDGRGLPDDLTSVAKRLGLLVRLALAQVG